MFVIIVTAHRTSNFHLYSMALNDSQCDILSHLVGKKRAAQLPLQVSVRGCSFVLEANPALWQSDPLAIVICPLIPLGRHQAAIVTVQLFASEVMVCALYAALSGSSHHLSSEALCQ